MRPNQTKNSAIQQRRNIMFRLEIFCDDKKLAQVLHALQGLVLENPKINPVVNAKANGKGEIQQATSGLAIDLFIERLRTDKPGVVNTPYMREFLESIGRSPRSVGSLVEAAKDAGVLKKNASTGKSKRTGWSIKRLPPQRA
jgi:hypothetical protein